MTTRTHYEILFEELEHANPGGLYARVTAFTRRNRYRFVNKKDAEFAMTYLRAVKLEKKRMVLVKITQEFEPLT